MSLSRVPVIAIKPLPVLAAMLSAALLSGCGDDRGEDTRVDRAVVVKVSGARTDANGNLFKIRNEVWQRPAVTVTPVLKKVEESILCDVTSTATTELGADKDSSCAITGLNSDGTATVATPCSVNAGKSRYTSVLGYFDAIFINNSTSLEQKMSIEGMAINVTIVNSIQAEVFNFTRDNVDYQDWLSEVANLRINDIGDTCAKQGIYAISDGVSTPAAAYLGTFDLPYTLTLTQANSEDFRLTFAWDGKDATGNDVPAGTYTAHFDITVKDSTTNEYWEDPAPLTFTIAD